MKVLSVSLLWSASVLTGLHWFLLFLSNSTKSELGTQHVLWITNISTVKTVLFALGFALLGTLIAHSTRRSAKGVRVLFTLITAVLFAQCISGIGYEHAARVPDLDTFRGQIVWGAISLIALVHAFVLMRFHSREQPISNPPRAFAFPGIFFVSMAIFSLTISVPYLFVGDILWTLLEEQKAYTVVKEGPGGGPSEGALTATMDWEGKSGERPTLIIPPGGEVSFVIPDVGSNLYLQTSAGVGLRSHDESRDVWDYRDFKFEVLVDSELISETSIQVGNKVRNKVGWSDIGGELGVRVRPGNVVTMRTSVSSEPYDERVQSFGWRVGFSEPVLVRHRQLPRTLSSVDKPNIVLIVMDTQRADRLGCYGYEKDTSPNIDKLAERGTVYEQGKATSSWTWPSTASILTGMTPQRHGVISDDASYVARNYDLLAESLQRQGFTTAAFSGSTLISASKNFDQGFEFFSGTRNSFEKSRMIMPRAIEWLDTFSDHRFFLYLHLVDPHHPHEPNLAAKAKFVTLEPGEKHNARTYHDQTWALRKGNAKRKGKPWDASLIVPEREQQRISDLYDACVATGDYWVGKLMNTLEDLEVSDKTIVAFTSDHGEEFFEHGMLEHGHALFPELINVPLILAGPGIPVGKRSPIAVSNRHLATTLALLGGSSINGVNDGLNLARPESLSQLPVVFGTEHGWWNNWYRTPLQGMRDGQWVLHLAPLAGEWGERTPTPGGQIKLYDLSADSLLLKDVSLDNPDRATLMKSQLMEYTEEQRKLRKTISVSAGDETLEMLEGIGYIESGDEE
ncbi:MAG: arylsulfatase A-like enzyme [Planctomycetota bacterium]|jgi:arylsulfatase A-like enzyme